MIRRYLKYAVILILCISLSGCAGLQRKFTRKKKKEVDKPAPVITTYDYAKNLRVDELYKKHFLYWKTWQGELIDRMDASYKKRIECYEGILENLSDMKKYLASTKADELSPSIEKIKSIDKGIRKKRLTRSEKNKMRSLLEKTKLRIDKGFAYSKVKDHLEMEK